MVELNDYKVGVFPFIRTPNPSEKTHDYFYKNCIAQYSCFYRGYGYIPYDRTTKFIELRQFSQGNQPKDFYKKYLTPVEYGEEISVDPTIGVMANATSKTSNSGFINVLWDVMSTAPRLMSGMIGTLTRYKTDLSADPIDAISRNSIEDEKVKLKAQTDNHKFYSELYSNLGVQYKPPDQMPEDDEELQIYEDFGKFKPYFALVMEKLFKHTMDACYWEEIEKKLYTDAIAIGVIGVIDEYDPEDGKWKPSYVDPATAGVQWSKYSDCRDSTYGWDFFDENISTIRQHLRDQFKELSDTEFENNIIKDIAKAFLGYQKNPTVDFWTQYNKCDPYGNWKYDNFKVSVMRNRWIDTQGRQDVFYDNKYGQGRTYQIAWDKREKSKDGKTYQFTEKRMLFQANWIVGTKYMYNWGPASDQNKPTKRDVTLPYHFYIYDGKSIVEQLVPVFHNFQQLWLKYLNCINSAVNDGYNINIDYLMNIAVSEQNDESAKKDGVDYTTVRRFLETGLNYYSTINPTGMNNANTAPISRLPGGMGLMFQDLIKAFAFNIQLVEMLTGINPIVLGGTPNTEAPVGTTQMSVEAVSNILKPITDGYMSVKRNMAINLVRYIQLSIKHNAFSRKQYGKFLGDMDIAVMVASENDSTEYAINFTPRPTDLEKQVFVKSITDAIVAGQLAPFDEVLFATRLDAGIPMKQIMLEFKYRQRKFMKDQAKIAAAKSKQEHDNRVQEITAGTQAQAQLEDKMHKNKMEEIDSEGQWAIQKAQVQEGIRKEKEEIIQDKKNAFEKTPAK
jgi:hypothetical protein